MDNREPYSIILRQKAMLVTAVIETAEDLALFERAYQSARDAFETVALARGIEARRAATGTGAVEDESPVGEADAP